MPIIPILSCVVPLVLNSSARQHARLRERSTLAPSSVTNVGVEMRAPTTMPWARPLATCLARATPPRCAVVLTP